MLMMLLMMMLLMRMKIPLNVIGSHLRKHRRAKRNHIHQGGGCSCCRAWKQKGCCCFCWNEMTNHHRAPPPPPPPPPLEVGSKWSERQHGGGGVLWCGDFAFLVPSFFTAERSIFFFVPTGRFNTNEPLLVALVRWPVCWRGGG